MLPSIGDLEAWRLSSEFGYPVDLVDVNSLSPGPQEVGFVQALQRRLGDFDENPDLHPRKNEDRSPPVLLPSTRNLFDKIKKAFRPPDDGGLDQDRAFEGLAMLQQIETHRLRLVDAATEAINAGPKENVNPTLIELNRTATRRYLLFQLGFRVHCLLGLLAQGNIDRLKAATTMARFDSLFPPACAGDEANPSFCTGEEREKIRLFIDEHVMRPNTMPQETGQSFDIRFTSICELASYKDCLTSMVEYLEEFKELEELYFKIPHQIEKRREGPLDHDSPRSLSYIASSDGSKSLGTVQTTSRSSNAIAVETNTITAAPFSSRLSSTSTPITHITSKNITPILKDIPDYEPSAAKADVATFARGHPALDASIDPYHLSDAEHPFAKHIKLTRCEMEQLGLILRTGHSSRNSLYKFDGDDNNGDGTQDLEKPVESTRKKLTLSKRKGKVSNDMTAVPPFPFIPETFKQFIASKRVGKRIDDMKTESECARAIQPLSIGRNSDHSTLLKPSRSQRRPILKSQISGPKLDYVGALPFSKVSEDGIDETKRLSNDGVCLHSDINLTLEHHVEESCASKCSFSIERPRISSRQYAQMYLVNEVQNKRENQNSELPYPIKEWLWVSGGEKFLIIPKIPWEIRRDKPRRMPSNVTFDKGSSATHTFAKLPPAAAYPRLSPHLGGMRTLQSSATNLSSVTTAKSPDSAISSLRHTKDSHAELCSHSHHCRENEMPSVPQANHTPSTPHSAAAERTSFHDADVSPSKDVNSPSNESTELTQGSPLILLPKTYQPPVHEFQNKATSPCQTPNKPQSYSPLGVKIPPLDTNLLPISRPVSTSEAQPPGMEDGPTPRRIQCMSASIISDATTEDFSLKPNEASSPGILFGLRRSPQGRFERSRRTSSLNWNRYTSSRRHSFDTRITMPTHSRTVSSDSNTQYGRDSLISSALYSRSLEIDPFTEGGLHSSPTSQENPTSTTPVPDSPTLGHKNDESGLVGIADSRDEIHEQQSFNLLKTYMRSRRNRAKHSNGESDPSTSTHRSATTTLDSEQGGVHCYSSSFALNKAKSHAAFTLLPQPSPTSNQDIHTSSPPNANTLPTLPPSYPFRKPAKTCSISEKSTALSLQMFDTKSRLASVANKRDSITPISSPPNQSCNAQKQPRIAKPSRLGNLFSGHIRGRSSGSSTAEVQPPVANAYTTDEKTLRDPGNTRDHGELQDESASIHSQPSMLDTQFQEQHPRVGSGSSYSNTSSSGIAGLRDRLKLKLASSQVKQ